MNANSDLPRVEILELVKLCIFIKQIEIDFLVGFSSLLTFVRRWLH